VNATARTMFVVLIAFSCWVVSAGTAAAHTALASSDPAEGTMEDTAPAVVTLTFTENISPEFANIAVSGSDGRNWVSGPAQVTGPLLRISLSPDLPDGADYTVGYRVVSADGHPVSGSFSFTVAPVSGASAPPPPTTAAPTTTTTSPTATPPTSSGPLGSDSKTSVLTAAAAGLLLGGAIVFWQSRRRRRNDPPHNEPS